MKKKKDWLYISRGFEEINNSLFFPPDYWSFINAVILAQRYN